MAITDKEEGVWSVDQVYNKINQGGIWSYTGANELWTSGRNWYGQLGLNTRTNYSSPKQISGSWDPNGGGGNAGDVNYNRTAFIKTDNTLWTWGNNQYGMGFPTSLAYNTRYSSPVQVPGTTWSSVSLGFNNYLVSKTDGTLWSWGYNHGGNLGLNNGTNYSSPVQIPGTTWSNSHGSGGAKDYKGIGSLAIKTDGTLWSWGYNENGELGINDVSNYSSPKQIPGSTWKSIGRGNTNVTGLKTDGTLWAWGDNAIGQLGLNNKTQYSSPVQVGTDTTWDEISVGNDFVVAVKTDNTLWSWGNNEVGELGQNDLTDYSSPKQIPGTTWKAAKTSHTVVTQNKAGAVKTDGTLWMWGRNNDGDLGLSNQTQRSSPTQVGTNTDWTNLAFGTQQGFGFKDN